MLNNDKVKRTMLIVFGFMAFFASLIQNIYTPIIPQLQSDFNVSLLWVNFTVGGFIFIVAIMQIILGKYIDSKNLKYVTNSNWYYIIRKYSLCYHKHIYYFRNIPSFSSYRMWNDSINSYYITCRCFI